MSQDDDVPISDHILEDAPIPPSSGSHRNRPRKKQKYYPASHAKYRAKEKAIVESLRADMIQRNGEDILKRPKINDGKEVIHTVKGNVIVERDPVTKKIINTYKNPVGSPVVVLTPDQRVEFLRIVEGGFGKAMACKAIKVDFHILEKTFEYDPDFKKAYQLYEQAKVEECKGTVWAAGISGNITAAAMYVRMHSEERNQSRQLSMQKRELKLREEAMARSAGLDLADDKPNFDNLDRQEFNLFTDLHYRVKTGAKLDINEEVQYSRFMRRLFAPKEGVKTPKGQMESHTSVDKLTNEVIGGWNGKIPMTTSTNGNLEHNNNGNGQHNQ